MVNLSLYDEARAVLRHYGGACKSFKPHLPRSDLLKVSIIGNIMYIVKRVRVQFKHILLENVVCLKSHLFQPVNTC